MATALDLLMSTKEDVNLLSEESDICTIDAKTRVIFVPSTIVVGGVQSDKNAERIKFSCPKIVGDNLDLSKFSVRINFENVSSVDFNVSIKDQYICDDVAVDGENVTFSWLIGRNAARYMGTVRFIVCAVKTDSDSNINVEWNTAIAEVPVLEGIEIDQPQIGQEEKDVINQLLELTKNTSAEAVQNVNSAKEQAIKDIQSVSQPDTTLTIEGGLAEAKATGEAIGSLKGDLDDIAAKEKRNTFAMKSGDISDDGSIAPSSTYGVTDLIDVKYVSKNYIVIMESGVSVYIAQYKQDNTFISIKKYSENSLIQLNAETRYVRLNSKLSNENKFYIKYKIVSNEELNDRFDSIANITPELSITTDVLTLFVSEKTLDDNGTEINDPLFSATGYIYYKLINGGKYTVNNASAVMYMYLYDANRTFLRRVDIKNNSYLKIPSDSIYVRFTTKTVNIDSRYFNIVAKTELATIADINDNLSESCVLSLKTILDFGTLDDSGKYERSTYKKVTPKFIKVNVDTTYTPSFEGSLLCYEYNTNKEFIKNTVLTNNSSYLIDARTRYVKFASDHNTNWTGSIKFENLREIDFSYNERDGYDTLPFTFQFYGNKGLDYDGSNVEVDTKPYYTGALLRLPPNYSSVGDKVPLIYFAHGSGDYLDRNDTEFSKYYMDYIQYLQDEGFAIIDINGNTSKYTTTGSCQWGNPTNMAAIKQGIKWACANYNIDINRIYVISKSLGGLQAINMCYENDLHIKACCPLAPELDMLCDGLGYYPNERKNNADDLGFSVDSNGVLDTPYDKATERLYKKTDEYKQYIRDNAYKLLGHNPAWRGVIGISASEMVEYPISGDYNAQGKKMATQNRYCIVPTKIFISPDDTAVSYEMSKGYIQSLKNGGCVGELRTMPNGTGGHHSVDNDENALKVNEISTFCGVTHYNVPLAYVEVIQFFKRYS